MTSTMFDQFDTDKNLEMKGVWIDYGSFRVLLARAGGANKKYLSYSEKKTKPLRRAMEVGTLGEDRSRSILYDIFAQTVVLAWEISKGTDDETGETIWESGIHAKDGSIIEFNKANVISTFNLLPNLFFDLQSSAQSTAIYRKEDMEDDSGN